MNGLLVVFLTLSAASALNLGSDRLVTRDLFDSTSDFLEPAYHPIVRRQGGLLASGGTSTKPPALVGPGTPPNKQTGNQQPGGALGGANSTTGSVTKNQTATGTKSSEERTQRRIADLTKRIENLKARLAKEEAALAKLKNPSSSGDKPRKDGDKLGKEGDKPGKNGDKLNDDPKKPSKSDKSSGTPTTGAPLSTESPVPVGNDSKAPGSTQDAPGGGNTSKDAPVPTNSVAPAGNPVTSGQAATMPVAVPGARL